MRRLLLFVAAAAWSCAPPPTSTLELTTPDDLRLLNGRFHFASEDRPEFAGTDYDDSGWRLVPVPGLWQSLGLRHDGVGWYRIHFATTEATRSIDLAVMVPYVLAAHEVFVNGVRLGGLGRVAALQADLRPHVQVTTLRIPKEILRPQNVLALRVRGYRSIGGVALHDFYLGSEQRVDEAFQRYLIWNSALTGVAFIIGLYYLTLFLLSRRTDRAYLYFALLAFCAAAYTGASKTLDAWIAPHFLVHEFLIQAAVAVAPYVAFRFFRENFEWRSAWYERPLVLACPVLGLVAAGGLVSSSVYEFHLTYTFPLQSLLLIASFAYLLWRNLRAVSRHELGARTILIGNLVFFATLLNDGLSHNFQLSSDRLFEEGFVVLVCAMAVSLGMKLNHSLQQTDRLNRELDSQVHERTRDYQLAAREAERARHEVEKLNEFTRRINETTDLDTILDLIISHVEENFNLDGTMLHLLDRQTNELRFYRVTERDFHTAEHRRLAESLVFPMDERGGMVWQLVRRGRAIYLPRFPDVRDENDPIVRLRLGTAFQSGMIVPLVVRGEAIGVLFFTNFTKKMELRRDQIASIKRFSEQIAGAVYSSYLLGQVRGEREKSDRLLLNILPARVADELRERGAVEPHEYEMVTVMFTDFVGFTKIAEQMPAGELIKELDGCFTQFDEVAVRHGLEKLKTIGDAYMCAGGLPVPNASHAVDACLAALEYQALMAQMSALKGELGLDYWSLRLGLHSGPVTAGVVGKNKFAYDIWGDTVNTASRMESSGEANRVNISGATYSLVKDFFECEHRGRVAAKGKGQIDMYFLNALRPELARDEEGRRPNALFFKRYSEL